MDLVKYMKLTAERLVSKLVGLPIAHVWRGYGSALILELGALSTAASRDKHPTGDMSITFGWAWRVERYRSILGGSDSTERRASSVAQKIATKRLCNVTIVGRVPELLLHLEEGFRVQSFTPEQGQPAWSIIDHSQGGAAVCVKAGRLALQSGAS